MPQLVPTLIVSDLPLSGERLRSGLSAGIDDYLFDFKHSYPERALEAGNSPYIIFIINEKDQGISNRENLIATLSHNFHGAVIIAVVEEADIAALRPIFIKAGADEVLGLGQIDSYVGHRLIAQFLNLQKTLEAEKKLQESEERFRGIIERANDIVTLLDAEGTILYNSPAFERQMGYAPWEILGQNFFEYVHRSDRPAVMRTFKDLLATGKADEVRVMGFRFLHKNGDWHHVSSIPTNQLQNEAVRAVVLNSRDVTEAKEIELELEKHRQKLEELVEQRTREAEDANIRAESVLSASPVSLLAIDDAGIITFVSRHYHQAYPQTVKSLVPGKHISEIFDVVATAMDIKSDDARYEGLKNWWQAPKGAMELALKTGTWLWIQAQRMSNQRGTVILTTNITDHKRNEAILAASLEQERKALEQQRRFVSVVSHEFRTPLAIIDGNAQILQSRGGTLEPPVFVKRAGNIRDSVGRLVSLIDDLLSADVLEAGKLHLAFEKCDLKDIIVVVSQEQEEISGRHKVRLDIDALGEPVHADRKIMRQVFSNLINNAIKYSPETTEIDVKATVQAATGKRYVVIEVIDSGIGIPLDELPRIFERFFRASTAMHIPGTGVGLSLVRELVELHQGSVEVTSEVGKGTTLTVRLPMDEKRA